MLDRAGDDYTLKRNLILMTVKNVRCIDREGHIEVSVMTKGQKWRREGLSPQLIEYHEITAVSFLLSFRIARYYTPSADRRFFADGGKTEILCPLMGKNGGNIFQSPDSSSISPFSMRKPTPYGHQSISNKSVELPPGEKMGKCFSCQ